MPESRVKSFIPWDGGGGTHTSVSTGPWDPWVSSGPVCVIVPAVHATPPSLPLPPAISPSLFLHHLPQTMFICFSSRSLGSPPTPTFFSQFGPGQCFLRMIRNEPRGENALLLTLPLCVTMSKFLHLLRKQKVEPLTVITDILQIPGRKLRIFQD